MPVFSALKILSSSDDDDFQPDSMLSLLSTFNSLFVVCLMSMAANELKIVSKLLQRVDIDLIASHEYIERTKMVFEQFLHKPANFLEMIASCKGELKSTF